MVGMDDPAAIDIIVTVDTPQMVPSQQNSPAPPRVEASPNQVVALPQGGGAAVTSLPDNSQTQDYTNSKSAAGKGDVNNDDGMWLQNAKQDHDDFLNGLNADTQATAPDNVVSQQPREAPLPVPPSSCHYDPPPHAAPTFSSPGLLGDAHAPRLQRSVVVFAKNGLGSDVLVSELYTLLCGFGVGFWRCHFCVL